MTIKAVGFDLDDTLYSRGNFYGFVFGVMEESIIKTGLAFSEFYKFFQKHSDIEYEKFIRQGKARDAYKNDRVIATYKEFGYEVTESDAIVFNSLYLYFRSNIELRQGVESVFARLIEKGIEIFILTNGPSEDQRNKLKQLNIKKYVSEDKWFISDELGYSKPDLAIYKHVQESLGYSNEELIYVGDDYNNDIVGSKNAGWEAVFLNVHNYKVEKEDLLVIDEMDSLLEYFNK